MELQLSLELCNQKKMCILFSDRVPWLKCQLCDAHYSKLLGHIWHGNQLGLRVWLWMLLISYRPGKTDLLNSGVITWKNVHLHEIVSHATRPMPSNNKNEAWAPCGKCLTKEDMYDNLLVFSNQKSDCQIMNVVWKHNPMPYGRWTKRCLQSHISIDGA